MTKIRTIQIKNCKAISEIAVNLDGCSAIVTAANDKGKSTLAKVLIDRLPDFEGGDIQYQLIKD